MPRRDNLCRRERTRKNHHVVLMRKFDYFRNESRACQKLRSGVQASTRRFEVNDIGADDHFRKLLRKIGNDVSGTRHDHADFRNGNACGMECLTGEPRVVSRGRVQLGMDGGNDPELLDAEPDVFFLWNHGRLLVPTAWRICSIEVRYAASV